MNLFVNFAKSLLIRSIRAPRFFCSRAFKLSNTINHSAPSTLLNIANHSLISFLYSFRYSATVWNINEVIVSHFSQLSPSNFNHIFRTLHFNSNGIFILKLQQKLLFIILNFALSVNNWVKITLKQKTNHLYIVKKKQKMSTAQTKGCIIPNWASLLTQCSPMNESWKKDYFHLNMLIHV